jgi:hypothetical protein
LTNIAKDLDITGKRIEGGKIEEKRRAVLFLLLALAKNESSRPGTNSTVYKRRAIQIQSVCLGLDSFFLIREGIGDRNENEQSSLRIFTSLRFPARAPPDYK